MKRSEEQFEDEPLGSVEQRLALHTNAQLVDWYFIRSINSLGSLILVGFFFLCHCYKMHHEIQLFQKTILSWTLDQIKLELTNMCC